MSKNFECYVCGRQGLKTNGEGKVMCEKCIQKAEALTHPPYKREAPKIKRNQKCTCGSHLKYKLCCINLK